MWLIVWCRPGKASNANTDVFVLQLFIGFRSPNYQRPAHLDTNPLGKVGMVKKLFDVANPPRLIYFARGELV
ncbi:MAG TPA: hypothetical protein VJT54_01425 [Verrucomicrobiae bacterium]|nr:hypothetical protein [Verrucomicrobiae bacterium]